MRSRHHDWCSPVCERYHDIGDQAELHTTTVLHVQHSGQWTWDVSNLSSAALEFRSLRSVWQYNKTFYIFISVFPLKLSINWVHSSYISRICRIYPEYVTGFVPALMCLIFLYCVYLECLVMSTVIYIISLLSTLAIKTINLT